MISINAVAQLPPEMVPPAVISFSAARKFQTEVSIDISLPHARHDFHGFQRQTTAEQFSRFVEHHMPAAKVRACTILGEFEQAQGELVGKAVIFSDGKAGTVERVCLDEIHGLRASLFADTKGTGPSDHQIRSGGLRRWRQMNALGFSAGRRHPGVTHLCEVISYVSVS